MDDDFAAWLLEVDCKRDKQGLVPLSNREANLMREAWEACRPKAYGNGYREGHSSALREIKQWIVNAGTAGDTPAA